MHHPMCFHRGPGIYNLFLYGSFRQNLSARLLHATPAFSCLSPPSKFRHAMSPFPLLPPPSFLEQTVVPCGAPIFSGSCRWHLATAAGAGGFNEAFARSLPFPSFLAVRREREKPTVATNALGAKMTVWPTDRQRGAEQQTHQQLSRQASLSPLVLPRPLPLRTTGAIARSTVHYIAYSMLFVHRLPVTAQVTPS